MIECDFRSIKPVFQLIENRLESFLKHKLFTCSSLFQNFSKSFLALSLRPIQRKCFFFFCRFPLNFSQGFCRLAPVRPFYPFFFSLISFFIHFFMDFREIFGPNSFWDFWCLRGFLSKLINGFLLVDDVNMFFMIRFDQFGEMVSFWISRAWNYPNWGFCLIGLNLMKLACVIDSFCHYILLSNLCNDKLINLLGFLKVGFQNLGFLL